MESLDPKYVEVYRARNLPEAHSIRIALEESGIRVQIENELLQGAVGDLPPGWTTAPRILVKKSQVLAARRIIEQGENEACAELDEHEHNEVIRCLACGKEIAEGEVKCRWCGWSYQGGEDSGEKESLSGGPIKKWSAAASPEPLAGAPSIPPSPKPTLSRKILAVLTAVNSPRFYSILRWCFFGTIITTGLWLLMSGKIFLSAKDSYERALTHFRAGDNDQAIAMFSQAIRLDPGLAEAWHYRGYAYELKGDYDRAIDDYTEAIRLNASYAKAFNGRAVAYFKKGDYNKAIIDYNRAIQLDPDRSTLSDVYIGRGRAYSKKEDHDRSIADFSRAIQLNPTDAYLYRSRGFEYGRMGETEKAIADYTEAIRLEPESKIALHGRAIQYARKGELDKAIDDVSEAIRLDPEFAYSYRARSFLHDKKGDAQKGKADLEKAIELESARAKR
jgi:tetratricopeptide (TPR) repeat protein